MDVKDRRVIALSNIMQGLLASGHYTFKDNEGKPELLEEDLGEDWKLDQGIDPAAQAQFVPNVLLDALDLFAMMQKSLRVISRSEEDIS